MSRILLHTARTWGRDLFGDQTNKHIVIFDSDDWGLVRNSKEAIESLSKDGLLSHADWFEKLDGLESADDLQLLSSLLHCFSDEYNNPPVFSLNFVLNNPYVIGTDSNYRIAFVKTRDVYSQRSECADILKKIQNDKAFQPQFHSWSHLDVKTYLLDLQTGNSDSRLFLKHGAIGCSSKELRPFGYMDEMRSFPYPKSMEAYLNAGDKEFFKYFGFHSISFVPSCLVVSPEIQKITPPPFLKIIKTGFYTYWPENEMYKKHFSPLRKSKNGLLFIPRNCDFEPYWMNDPINYCLSDISMAFLQKKPAVISTHRLNYTSRIPGNKRNENLDKLFLLLKKIKEKFPDVIFANWNQIESMLLLD